MTQATRNQRVMNMTFIPGSSTVVGQKIHVPNENPVKSAIKLQRDDL